MVMYIGRQVTGKGDKAPILVGIEERSVVSQVLTILCLKPTIPIQIILRSCDRHPLVYLQGAELNFTVSHAWVPQLVITYQHKLTQVRPGLNPRR